MVKKIIKLTLDITMFLLFVLLMEYHMLSSVVHEGLGITLFILFIVHNALNYKWYAVLLMGKYTFGRILKTLFISFLWIAMLGCMISSLLVSRKVFSWINIRGAETGRYLHMLSTSWTFVLMCIHLGLHWILFVKMTKRHLKIKESILTIVKWILRAIVFAISIYGIIVIIQRAFYEELFLLTEFKQFNYDISAFYYFLQTTTMSITFISLTYYLKKIESYIKKWRKNR